MQVYIEDVFLDNFIIDLCLLYATARILRLKTRPLALITSACLGVGAVVLSLAITLPAWASIFYKLFTSALMLSIIMPSRASLKKWLLAFGLFWALSLLCGGACSAIALTFGSIHTLENGTISYSLALPMGVVVGGVALLTITACRLARAIKKNLCTNNFIYSATLSLGSKSITVDAFLDSGNRLIDPVSSKPIIFITYPQFCSLVDAETATNALLKKPSKALKNMHYITCQTIGPSQKLLVFDIESICLQNSKKKFTLHSPSLALTFSSLNSTGCGLLFGPDALLYGEQNEHI